MGGPAARAARAARAKRWRLFLMALRLHLCDKKKKQAAATSNWNLSYLACVHGAGAMLNASHP